jgi:hypothetical protein
MHGENLNALKEEENRHRAETEGRFTERFKGDVIYLVSETVSRGVITEEEIWPLTLRGGAFSIYDIERAADALAIAGNRLVGR